MRNYPEEKMETGGNRLQHRKKELSQGFKASGKCLSNNMQEYEEQLIFTLAALRAGTSALAAAISQAFSPRTHDMN